MRHTFGGTQRAVARLAKRPAHPARVAMQQHPAKTKTRISGDIAQELLLNRPPSD